MKNIISFIVLLQVGSNLWVNPDQVGAVRKPLDGFENCPTMLIVEGVYTCSDWSMDKVNDVLIGKEDKTRAKDITEDADEIPFPVS
jgi:hypothetical protein